MALTPYPNLRGKQGVINKQVSGMRGVFLVAAELSRQGFIVSPTSRSSAGADLLVTDNLCRLAFSVQVKTNTRNFGFWLLSQKSREITSPTHIYVLVNLRGENSIEFFVVPSDIIARDMAEDVQRGRTWYSFSYASAKPYENKWGLFGDVEQEDRTGRFVSGYDEPLVESEEQITLDKKASKPTIKRR
jgi:hypothetical protein